jgi:glycosyltransferase involved in cell wall biosynthesis
MISIIIPTLNEEKVIGKTISSLQRLHGYDFEIIVSDGKSKDKTVEIAKSLGAQVVIYEGITRQTIGAGRNLGTSLASGEFFVFLDADVTIPDIDNFFKKTLNLFEKNKKIMALVVRQEVSPEVETFADKFFFTIVNYVYFMLNNILHFGGAGGEFQMIRASAFKDLGGFNEQLAAGEDNDMFQRLAKRGRTRMLLSLKVIHMGRRAHKTGWPKLLFTWVTNWLSALLFNNSVSKVWEEIR